MLPPGVVTVTAEKDSFELLKGEVLDLTLRMKSTSPYREVVSITVDEAFGTLSTGSVAVEPMEDREVTFTFTPAVEADGVPVTVPLSLTIGNELTSLTYETVEVDIMVTTTAARLMNQIRENSMLILGIIIALLVLILVIYIIGRMLYRKNFSRLYQVTGKLYYEKANKENEKVQEAGVLDLTALGKSKVVVTFSDSGKDTADFYISGSTYAYDLIFEKLMEKSRFRFVDGYRSLSRKTPPKVIIRTTEPGILMIGDTILVRHEVDKEVNFISGEYRFHYESAGVGKLPAEEGKNILDGKF